MTLQHRENHTAANSSTDDLRYRPFLAGLDTTLTPQDDDWTKDLDLQGATDFSKGVWGDARLKVLVLYGSLRQT